ncbi:MAG: hypothetical protein ACMXYK_03195 [Candidatus Woesearchaeota archaeon]
MNTKIIILGVLAMLLIAGCTSQETIQDEPSDMFVDDSQTDIPVVDPFESQQPQTLELPEVVATVNGEEIRGQEVAELFQQFEIMGFDASLDQIISEISIGIVLRQEADRQGITVTTEEVEEFFISEGFSTEEIQEIATMEGMDYTEFLEMQKEDVKIMILMQNIQEEQNLSGEESREQVINLAYQLLEEAEIQTFI